MVSGSRKPMPYFQYSLQNKIHGRIGYLTGYKDLLCLLNASVPPWNLIPKDSRAKKKLLWLLFLTHSFPGQLCVTTEMSYRYLQVLYYSCTKLLYTLCYIDSFKLCDDFYNNGSNYFGGGKSSKKFANLAVLIFYQKDLICQFSMFRFQMRFIRNRCL